MSAINAGTSGSFTCGLRSGSPKAVEVKSCRRNARDNPSRGGIHFLMLPDPHGRPAARCQKPVCFGIPRLVAGDLVGPVPRVCLWRVAVVGAAMPEAAVNEHRYPAVREQDVSCAPKIRQRPPVYEEAESLRVQGTSESQLGRRVPGPLRTHSRAAVWIGSEGPRHRTRFHCLPEHVEQWVDGRSRGAVTSSTMRLVTRRRKARTAACDLQRC